MYVSRVFLVCSLPLLAACSNAPMTGEGSSGSGFGSGTPSSEESVNTVVRNADGSYTVTQGDVMVNIDPDDINYNAHGAGRHFGKDSEKRGFAIHEGEDFIVAAGLTEGGGFGGIAGTPSGRPSADATYDVAYDLARQNNVGGGNMQLTYGYESNTLSGQDDRLNINATAAADGTFSGTVDVTWGPIDESGSVTGMFFGEDEIAGAMVGENFGGVFSGAQTPDP